MIDVHYLENPATAQWGHAISHSDYSKMLKGWRPRSMDDKWMIITDTPDGEGSTVVRICRSWTSREMYLFTVTASNPKNGGKDWATITKIAWNPHVGGEVISEEEAKRTAINFCKGLMRCELKD